MVFWFIRQIFRLIQNEERAKQTAVLISWVSQLIRVISLSVSPPLGWYGALTHWRVGVGVVGESEPARCPFHRLHMQYTPHSGVATLTTRRRAATYTGSQSLFSPSQHRTVVRSLETVSRVLCSCGERALPGVVNMCSFFKPIGSLIVVGKWKLDLLKSQFVKQLDSLV